MWWSWRLRYDVQPGTVQRRGPFVCGYLLHLLSSSASCTVPLGAQGYESLMQRLSELPGFDRAAAGAATPSTQNAVFRCWRRAVA
jgi:hypothetical protein